MSVCLSVCLYVCMYVCMYDEINMYIERDSSFFKGMSGCCFGQVPYRSSHSPPRACKQRAGWTTGGRGAHLKPRRRRRTGREPECDPGRKCQPMTCRTTSSGGEAGSLFYSGTSYGLFSFWLAALGEMFAQVLNTSAPGPDFLHSMLFFIEATHLTCGGDLENRDPGGWDVSKGLPHTPCKQASKQASQ